MGGLGAYWYGDKEEAEERGHRRIYCAVHKYRGWSEDTGGCPYCAEDEAVDRPARPTPAMQAAMAQLKMLEHTDAPTEG